MRLRRSAQRAPQAALHAAADLAVAQLFIIWLWGVLMARSIMPIFDMFQDEAKVAGRLLAGYGELEFALHDCLTAVMGDINVAAKVLYRARGEQHKIEIADAIMRDEFDYIGLITPYSDALSDMDWCRQIRNQFAHSHWDADHTRKNLRIFDLDRAARTKSGQVMARADYVNLTLLQSQEVFFLYVHDCLRYLCAEYQIRANSAAIPSLPVPTKVIRPPKHNTTP
jgi:hypothetical protein